MKDPVVIIPAFNEAEQLKKVIKGVKKHISHIIVVDDGSVDGTESVSKKEKIIYLQHVINLGKGAAMITGVMHALQAGFQTVIIMDADGQHDPSFLPEFVENLQHNDFVTGYRAINFRNSRIRYIGNRMNKLIIRLLFGQEIIDPLCGYRGFNLKIFNKIEWESTGYGVETEMIIRAIKNKVRIKEIPVSTIYIDKYKGVSILDAYKVFFDMLKWKIFL